jgi:hypothetical protein
MSTRPVGKNLFQKIVKKSMATIEVVFQMFGIALKNLHTHTRTHTGDSAILFHYTFFETVVAIHSTEY